VPLLPNAMKFSRRMTYSECQLRHQSLVESRDGGQVEALEALDRVDLASFHPTLDGALFQTNDLKLSRAW
jgi:hypothetical protein